MCAFTSARLKPCRADGSALGTSRYGRIEFRAGSPDLSMPFPAEMLVDYVRVYERGGGVGALVPRGAGRLPFRQR